MILVDWVIVGIIALSAVISLIRGFVVEALSIVIWVFALWAAFHFTSPFAQIFLGGIETESVRLGASALILMVCILILGSMLSFVVGRLVRSTGLSGSDRLLGMIFGAARGLLTVVSLVAVASWTPVCKDDWWQRSTLIPEMQEFAFFARGFLPPNLREIIGSCRANLPLAPAAEAEPSPAGTASGT